SSPMYLDILDLAGTGTFFLENVPGGAIKGAGGVAGGASYIDTINVSCSITPSGTAKYIGRFDCDLAIPNVPTLAGKTFRFQWHVQDPSGAGGFPRAVSTAGIIQLF
ncbi:MAG: hypothetical protein JNJ88_19675, partial [Planctomycetes bacterium]|nr:hypothetical protein [Planctomycetota bacterium]